MNIGSFSLSQLRYNTPIFPIHILSLCYVDPFKTYSAVARHYYIVKLVIIDSYHQITPHKSWISPFVLPNEHVCSLKQIMKFVVFFHLMKLIFDVV